MNVLIYDRSDNVRRTIENNVNKLGPSVKIVSVGNIPLAGFKLSTNSFDLIIIDVDNLNGRFMDIIQYAKASSPQASIILLTLTSREIIKEKYLRNGVDYYFNEFFRFEEFIDTIQNVAKQFLYDSYSYTGLSRVY